MKSYLHALVWTKRHWQGIYTAWEVAFLKKYIRQTDVCIDIGAHAGSWSVPLANVLVSGEVFGYEALPYYANTLSTTLKLLGKKNIRVRNKAVSDKPGHLELVWKDLSGAALTGYTHLAGATEGVSETIRVEAVCLDDEFKNEQRRIGFIKCDVEGAEFNVFKGSLNLLKTHRSVIYTEINEEWCRRYGHHSETVFDLLLSNGYVAHTLNREGNIKPQLQAGSGDFLFLPL